MRAVIERIETLSVDLFDGIPSQTSLADRRSLLAVQRATARRHPEYAYLEIGSHLGGSIQPYLLDPRCASTLVPPSCRTSLSAARSSRPGGRSCSTTSRSSTPPCWK